MADNKKTTTKKTTPSAVTPAERSLLDFIGQFESKGGDYNILYGGYKGKPEKPLTEMTLNEVYALQKKMKSSGSSAVGAHQFINDTLTDVAKQMKLSGDEIFSPELQDKMILHRLKKTRGFDKYLEGKIDEEEFALNLSKEFASIPNPKTGKSYYDGDGLNKSLTDVKQVLSQLQEVKKNHDNYLGDQSINPDEILNNPNLDEGTKEELLKANESEGLAQSTIQSVRGSATPWGGQYGGGYNGSADLNSFLVNDDTAKKKAKLATEGPKTQEAAQAEVTNEGQQALGYMGLIQAFDPKMNLIEADDEANKGYNKGGELNKDKRPKTTTSNTGTRLGRTILKNLGIPENAAQMASAFVNQDSKMGEKDTNYLIDSHLRRSIENAIKRTGKIQGGTEYRDYSPQVEKDINSLGANGLDAAVASAVSPEFQAATTYGRVSYKQNPETGEIEVYDTYDFSKTPAKNTAYGAIRQAAGNMSEGKLDSTPKVVMRFKPGQEAGFLEKAGDFITGQVPLPSLLNMDYADVQNINSNNLKRLEEYGGAAYKKAEEIGTKIYNAGKNLYNSFEQGGNLNAAQGANVMTEYNEGGSHEQNPHGGIPVGQNSQGGMNLVEQGETRHGDYIYSNEFTLDKKDAARFNLSPKYIGKSYSDISRDINSEMKTRPYDRLVKQTAEGNLNKLMMAQEAVRAQEAPEQDAQFNTGGNLATPPIQGGMGGFNMGGMGAVAGHMMQTGQQLFGDTGVDTTGASGRQKSVSVAGTAASSALSGAAAGTAIMPGIGTAIGAGVGLIGGLVGGSRQNKAAMEANQNAAIAENNKFRSEDAVAKKGGLLDTYLAYGGYNDPPVKYGPKRYQQGDIFNNILQNTRGIMGVPYHGGVHEIPQPPTRRGAPANEHNGYRNVPAQPVTPKEIQTASEQTIAPTTKSASGYVRPEFNNSAIDKVTGRDGYLTASEQGAIDGDNAVAAFKQWGNTYRPEGNMQHDPGKVAALNAENVASGNTGVTSGMAAATDQETSMRGWQPQELLRYAPTIGNLIQMATLKDAEQESYGRLDNRYKPQYADEMAMQNIVSQGAANTRSAIQNASGGSQSAARASLLGSQINETRGMSEAYMQMDNINRGQDEKAQQFNLGVDQYNHNVGMQETVANAQNRAARDMHKNNLLQNALNDMGEIGRESNLARILENTSGGYTTDGTKRGSMENVGFFSQLFNKKKEDGGVLDIAQQLFSR